jgi:TolB protein
VVKRTIAVPLVTIGLVLASIGLAAPANAALPGANGRIAFERFAGGADNLFTMQSDGSDVQQLTHFTDRAANRPAWSPDGTMVAFDELNIAKGSRQIYVINADGTGHHRVFSDQFFLDFSPSYSPDGSKIVFQRCRPDGDSCTIAVARSDGTGHVRNLAAFVPDSGQGEPVYSPDGSSIAYSGYFLNGVLVATYVMSADGTHVRRITRASRGAKLPDWAPDGSVLSVSHCCDADPSRLWTVRPDGTGLTEIFSGATVFGSSFAPDGTQIAFQSGSAIWVADANGNNATIVQHNAFDPVWGLQPGA